MLEVSGLEAGYGDGRVLFGVDLAVGAGEVVTLLGRNGMGKTTTLSTRLGTLLSGGEQQMLAIGRALMTNPRLLLLDEATEGLAPRIRDEIWRVLARLKEGGQAILVVDKNIAPLLRLADRHYMLEKGRTVWSGVSAELAAAVELQHRYLGV